MEIATSATQAANHAVNAEELLPLAQAAAS